MADVLGPAVANVQSLTVAQSDGRASRRLVVDDVSLAYQQHSRVNQRDNKELCPVDYCQFKLDTSRWRGGVTGKAFGLAVSRST